MHEILQDLRFGWRTGAGIRASPSVALATLVFGIGPNTAISSLGDAALPWDHRWAD